ncbi:ACT domain-containing protein [bacterium]|nr:ACT domain-containing protein [bacterium]
MDHPRLRLSVLPQMYIICSLPPDSKIFDCSDLSSFFSITKTSKELKIVCDENHIPGKCRKSENWKCMKVEGSFDLHTIGVLESIAAPLAKNKISLYVVSTYDTDYILIHATDLDSAVSCLTEYGHTFVDISDQS